MHLWIAGSGLHKLLCLVEYPLVAVAASVRTGQRICQSVQILCLHIHRTRPVLAHNVNTHRIGLGLFQREYVLDTGQGTAFQKNLDQTLQMQQFRGEDELN